MIFYHASTWIFLASVVTFLVLNTVENVIHYSIGRTSETEENTIIMPTKKDWIRIVITMILFSILQGFFTVMLWVVSPSRKSHKVVLG